MTPAATVPMFMPVVGLPELATPSSVKLPDTKLRPAGKASLKSVLVASAVPVRLSMPTVYVMTSPTLATARLAVFVETGKMGAPTLICKARAFITYWSPVVVPRAAALVWLFASWADTSTLVIS
jgi:hypothetical protein